MGIRNLSTALVAVTAELDAIGAVNPTNAAEMVATYQQDFWPDGGARGLKSALSPNAGASWATLPDSPFSACQGGPAPLTRVADPSVSYDAAGRAYKVGLSFDTHTPGQSAVFATTWLGTQWSPPKRDSPARDWRILQ
jgi:hypothetical protein